MIRIGARQDCSAAPAAAFHAISAPKLTSIDPPLPSSRSLIDLETRRKRGKVTPKKGELISGSGTSRALHRNGIISLRGFADYAESHRTRTKGLDEEALDIYSSPRYSTYTLVALQACSSLTPPSREARSTPSSNPVPHSQLEVAHSPKGMAEILT